MHLASIVKFSLMTSDEPNSPMTGWRQTNQILWWLDDVRRTIEINSPGWHWHWRCLTNMKINSPWWHWCQTNDGHSWFRPPSTLILPTSTFETGTVNTRQADSVISHAVLKFNCSNTYSGWRTELLVWLVTLVVAVGYNGWYFKSRGSFLFHAVWTIGSRGCHLTESVALERRDIPFSLFRLCISLTVE